MFRAVVFCTVGAIIALSPAITEARLQALQARRVVRMLSQMRWSAAGMESTLRSRVICTAKIFSTTSSFATRRACCSGTTVAS